MSSWTADCFSENKARKLKKNHSFPGRNSTLKLQFASGSRPNLVLDRVNTLPVLRQDLWLSDISFVHVNSHIRPFCDTEFWQHQWRQSFLLLTAVSIATLYMLDALCFSVCCSRSSCSSSILSLFFIFCVIYSNWKFNNFDLCYSSVELFSHSP